jgi:CubicO group peptidase (beta-lactamase class C family)
MESITKGVVALLVGIAFDRGWLKNLDASIFSFLPEYGDLRTPDKNKITLHHLLSMTSGLDWPERAISANNPENIVRRGYIASDPYRFVLERSVEASPGTVWNYNWRRRLASWPHTEEGRGTAARWIRQGRPFRASRD